MKRLPALLLPSVLLAGGILASSAVADAVPATRAWMFAGPLVLAGCVFAAARVAQRVGTARGGLPVAFALAALVPITGAIVGMSDPADVAGVLPLMGGGMYIALYTHAGECCEAKAAA